MLVLILDTRAPPCHTQCHILLRVCQILSPVVSDSILMPATPNEVHQVVFSTLKRRKQRHRCLKQPNMPVQGRSRVTNPVAAPRVCAPDLVCSMWY